ncbi:MAG: hypothetical protein IKJ05_02745 [Oscillospiraceae bacterium]|nr:hypothetical protein [Oscillospiraceae bacterium]
MKELNICISSSNRAFNIRSNSLRVLCSYNIENKYSTSLIFANNTYAHVNYKNIKFSSSVTKQNIWKLYVDMRIVVQKQNNMFYFEKTIPTESRPSSPIYENATTDYSKDAIYLYNQLIGDFCDLYNCIKDKETFKHQICEYLEETYLFNEDFDINNPDEVIEYENYLSDDIDEEPVIKKTTLRNEIKNDCKEFFISFYLSELDNERKKSFILLENVIKETPELNKIPHQFLQKEFENYLAKNYNDLIIPDIYYCKSDVLYTIGKHIYDTYQYDFFINNMEKNIDKILSGMNISIINKDEIYYHFKTKYSKANMQNNKEFNQDVKSFVKDYIAFYNLYDKFVSLFNSDNIKLEWNEKTIQLFKKYDKKEIPVDSQYFVEYEVYQYIIPYYRKHLFRKNSNKYKPTIEKLPNFISYATSVLDILFKYNILIDSEEKVLYNENGDINSAYDEIKNM